MDSLDVTSPANASPPDFDFNLPCRFFKSSFARSLSLNNNNVGNNNNNQCKSLDYDIRSNNNNNNCLLKNNNNIKGSGGGGLKPDVPPIPQRRLIPPDGTSLAPQPNQNEANNKLVGNDQSVAAAGNKPPALPARRPPPSLSLHTAAAAGASPAASHQQQQQQQQQKMTTSSLTQLRQQAFNQALSNSNAAVLPVNVATANGSRSQQQQQKQQQQQFNQKLINHYAVSSSGGGTGHNDSICSSSSSGSGSSNGSTNNNKSSTANFRRNIYVWPNKQNVEQDCNFYDADNDDDINFEYHDTTAANRQHQPTIPQLMIPTIMTTNAATSNQHQQLLQQQQQQQQQHPYDVVHDNATNVEALILQNQVDTLHWQLKQVETSCDMYRAVMEEVARFLERYQKQRQLQQQLQQQYQQQLAAQKHNNMEQISRSKSLYQVNAPAGGQDKLSALGNNLMDDSSASYLRVRSSTNLIDLKQNEGKNHKMTNAAAGRHSKDDHNYETGLAPSQSYSAFKDFTWRRSPKKANDSRSHNGKDDVDEKLNQEAFRLLRTIQNLLNTSQHQPDIAHPTHNLTQHQLYQRHSLAPCMGRISKAISTTSVSSVPGAPMHNSTSLALATNCAASTTSDSSAASPTIASASSNTLAPDMLFLRSANMRDSRLSLRSSTDSSVHSTSSVTSSASSKVETDEEPNTPFHSPPTNLLAQHKPHHLAGSSTEDESGFSSISSFPDIGVALNSTMLPSTAACTKSRSSAKGHEMKCPKTTNNDKEQQQQLQQDSRNSTLKANVVGLPLNSSQDMSHRWDSPSKTYHNASTKFQRFSALTNNEDANTVLWV